MDFCSRRMPKTGLTRWLKKISSINANKNYVGKLKKRIFFLAIRSMCLLLAFVLTISEIFYLWFWTVVYRAYNYMKKMCCQANEKKYAAWYKKFYLTIKITINYFDCIVLICKYLFPKSAAIWDVSKAARHFRKLTCGNDICGNDICGNSFAEPTFAENHLRKIICGKSFFIENDTSRWPGDSANRFLTSFYSSIQKIRTPAFKNKKIDIFLFHILIY